MKFMSEMLLKREIKRLENIKRTEDCEALYYLYKKELAVIEKLKINNIDMHGEIPEFNRRIMEQEIYFIKPQEFTAMKEKAEKYDIISAFVKEKEKNE